MRKFIVAIRPGFSGCMRSEERSYSAANTDMIGDAISFRTSPCATFKLPITMHYIIENNLYTLLLALRPSSSDNHTGSR